MSTVNFQIHIPDHKLERLRQKLALAEYPEDNAANAEDSWTKGPPVAEIKRLAGIWQTSFDWRGVETRLNEYPQYLTAVEVDGFGTHTIHHIHKQSVKQDAVPLLFLHGWPGSFLEVTKMLEDLVRGDGDGAPTFHVVAPSLIDFGFSYASRKVNRTCSQYSGLTNR
jgi:hypothetical protein